MESERDLPRRPEPTTTQAAHGRASFVRSGPSRAFLEVEYRTPELHVDLSAATLEEGIEQVCEREVAGMRASLGDLGSARGEQLSDGGGEPLVRRRWTDREQRTWSVSGGALDI